MVINIKGATSATMCFQIHFAGTTVFSADFFGGILLGTGTTTTLLSILLAFLRPFSYLFLFIPFLYLPNKCSSSSTIVWRACVFCFFLASLVAF